MNLHECHLDFETRQVYFSEQLTTCYDLLSENSRMDDVIIFSKTREEHLRHISKIINTFTKGHMRISSEKSFFFHQEIEYLGQMISHGRITVSPAKIKSIQAFETPQTLRQL